MKVKRIKRVTNPVSRKVLKTKKERAKAIKEANYYQRVKELRPFFGEMFKASEGYDLRKGPASWTPAQKRKITRYYRVMAPRIAGGDFVVKRYRRRDHLDDAIRASLQEELLPGQTAAVFSIEPDENIRIDFDKRHRVRVVRDGIAQESIVFDKDRFLEDWKAELDRNMEMTDAKLFKIITGANKSKQTFTRDQIYSEIASMIFRYSEEKILDKGWDQRWFGEWLNGIVAYKGVDMPTMKRRDDEHQKEIEARKLVKRKQKAQQQKALSPAAMRSIRATGRAGRVK